MNAEAGLEDRVLLLVATSKDATLTRDVLARAGIGSRACADGRDLLEELSRGAGALMLAEELLVNPVLSPLSGALAAQPPWSDVPVLVLARHGADSRAVAQVMDRFPNVTVIERPTRIASLVSAVRSTLRARRRQYQVRTLLGDLQQADQRKTEFLATLAHELRNPLAPISNALALLSHPRVDPAAAARHHALMRRQVDHMVRLVNDLMEVSRITRGKVDLQLRPVSLDAAIADAIELSRPLLEAAGHSLAVERVGDPLCVRGDAVRLAQVFANLLNNAGKYTPRGGRIGLAVHRDGTDAVVEVTDNGAGLAPEMLEGIFDMFVQVSGTSRVAQGGLGIGLTLVRSLVELHGGTVVASSPGLGRGSTFSVRLPLASEEASTAIGPAPAERSEMPVGCAVLVVDDNRDAADSLAELFSAMGASAEAAYSGEDALRRAARRRPDIAVLDIGMPDMDGCEVARRLRVMARGADLKLIALTGWGQVAQAQRILSAGFDHHLLKPVDPERLMELLRAPTEGGFGLAARA